MKVIAGILGVPLGTLVRETNQFRIQRLRKALLVVGTLALGALLAAGWAFWAQHRANRERLAAEHANSQANRLINEMLGDLGEKLRPLGKLDLLAKVSDAAKTYFTEMPEGHEQSDVIFQRAIMWMAHGDVLEAKNDASLALESFKKAQQTLESLEGHRTAALPEARRLYAVSFERIADVMEDSSVQEALQTAEIAVSRLKQLLAEGTRLPRSLLQRDLAQAHERMGDILEDGAADLKGARDHFEISCIIRRQLAADFGEKEPGFQRDFGVACARLGDVMKMEGRYSEARDAYQEGLAVRQGLLKKHGLNAIWISEVSRSYDSLALAEEALGNTQAALAAHQQALKIRSDLALYNPSDKKAQADQARSRQSTARLLAHAGQMDEAHKHLQEALTTQRDLATNERPDVKAAIDWIQSLRLAAEWGTQSQTNGTARPELIQAQEILHRLRQSAKASDNAKLDIVEARLNTDIAQASIISKTDGSNEEAIRLFKAAESKLEAHSLANPADVELHAEFLWVRGLRAATAHDEPTLNAAVTALESLDNDGRLSIAARSRWLGTLRGKINHAR